MRKGGALANLIWVAIVLGPLPLAAHEHGVLKLPSREFAPADTLHLAGEKFSHRTTLKLELVGSAGRFALGQVPTDSLGAFTLVVVVPAVVSPGGYRLIAVAADGDEVAALDVSVVTAREEPSGVAAASPESAAGTGARARAAGTGAGDTGEPSAEPVRLRRARSPTLTATAVAGIALSLALGGFLLRRPSDA